MDLHPRRRRAIVPLVACLLASLTAGAIAAPSPAPTLRLIRGKDHATLTSFRDKVRLNLPVWVAATGGDFQLELQRPDYDSPVEVTQVDPTTGEVLRSVPAEMVDGWRGLDGFFMITVRDAAGTTVAARELKFCPNSYERQRVDGSGDDVSRFPTNCGSFTFMKGNVWGIDSGWASSSLSEFGAPRLQLDPGEYSATVEISSDFVALFEVPVERSSVTFDVTVVEGRRRGPPYHEHITRASAAPEDDPNSDAPTVVQPDPTTLPDLVALPPWGVITTHGRKSGRDRLAFSATPWNAGPSPLVVEGYRRASDDVMDSYQYFYDANGEPVGRAPVGEMIFHEGRGHNHWHFLDFTTYTLLDSQGEEIVMSMKQSFCIANTDPVDLAVDGAAWNPYSTGFGSSCGGSDSIWVREKLEAGWGDTYFQGVAGQAFDITDLPNGWYQIEAHVNPLGNLYERDTTNNIERRLVHIGGEPGRRTALMAPWHGITD